METIIGNYKFNHPDNLRLSGWATRSLFRVEITDKNGKVLGVLKRVRRRIIFIPFGEISPEGIKILKGNKEIPFKVSHL
jgi:hypothetical protein